MGFHLPYFVREVLQNLKRNLLLNIITISTVLVLIFMLGFFMLFVENVDSMTQQVLKNLQITVELSDQLDLTRAGQLKFRIMKLPGVEAARYISKEEGFKRLQEKLKDKVALENLTRNPLPNIIEVDLEDPDYIFGTAAEIRKYPGVANVKYGDKEIINNVIRLSRVIFGAGIAVIVLLFVSAVFLIGNTIRLAVFSRRKEIAIMELVGAAHWFIRGPFVLEGIIHGFIGSALAVLFLNLTYYWVFIRMSIYLSILPIIPPNELLPLISVQLILAGSAVGCLTSLLAVNRYLKI